MNPILPILSILGYLAIVLGSLEVPVIPILFAVFELAVWTLTFCVSMVDNGGAKRFNCLEGSRRQLNSHHNYGIGYLKYTSKEDVGNYSGLYVRLTFMSGVGCRHRNFSRKLRF